MQTYSEFKDYVLDFCWRKNDVDLVANLDKIIRMADNELNRKLNVQRRELALTIAPETEDYALPADFRQVKSLTNLQTTRAARTTPMRVTSFAEIQRLRAVTLSRYVEPYYYVQRGPTQNTLFLVGPFSAENPGSLSLLYRTNVPDYQTADSSWVEQDYLDLYVYAVLKQVGVWLREDERIQQYAGLMMDALDSALEEDLHEVEFGGSPLDMKPTRYVPQTRRR